MSENLLPKDFQDLEQWSEWCLETDNERCAHRQSKEFEAIKSFYDAMLLRIEEIIAYLNNFPVDAMPTAERRLFLLALSLSEVGPAVEQFKQVQVIDGYDVSRIDARGRK